MTARSQRDLRYLRNATGLFVYAQTLQPDINAALRLVHDVLMAAFARPPGHLEAADDAPSLEHAVLARFQQELGTNPA